MHLAFALSPFLILGAGALLLMLAEAFAAKPGPGRVPNLALGGDSEDSAKGLALGTSIVFFTSAAFAGGIWLFGVDNLEGVSAVAPWLLIDKFTVFFEVLLCLGGGLSALLAGGYLPEHNLNRGEFYSLLIFSTLGAMILAAAGDLLTVFLGLETMSLGSYAMTAFRRASPRSAEGGLKYFLLSSFAAAVMVYGFALLYGVTGHTDLAGIGASLATGAAKNPIAILAMAFVLVGLVFKVSGVPFHMWTPDAYDGAPTPATTFMAVAVKSAGFAMMLRILLMSFGTAGFTSWASGWPPVIAWISVLTMTVANVIAGRQDSVKRMLAYSSIAHAGYLMLGVVACSRAPEATGSILFYLLAYTASTAGAFGTLILCGSRGKEAISYEDLSGIGRRHPAAALPFALFLFSLAGIPPTAGFFGKWFVFRSVIDSGFYILAVIALLNSVVAAYYYIRVLVFMYMREPAAGAPVAVPMRSGYVNTALLICAILVLVLGITPGSTLDVAQAAAVLHG